ncbi:hypothetical protein B0I32_14037 [Nonomuraea fuscirosea]|uniref:Uncharacterized protein n=1 Tax=Nonomuraea fuscirosea TaxID=1291556 RepID=A0A2T0LXN8_9ACTN|nr:hypothetical protein B0I32_14037 [Nonomuraea fuscirosea]
MPNTAMRARLTAAARGEKSVSSWICPGPGRGVRHAAVPSYARSCVRPSSGSSGNGPASPDRRCWSDRRRRHHHRPSAFSSRPARMPVKNWAARLSIADVARGHLRGSDDLLLDLGRYAPGTPRTTVRAAASSGWCGSRRPPAAAAPAAQDTQGCPLPRPSPGLSPPRSPITRSSRLTGSSAAQRRSSPQRISARNHIHTRKLPAQPLSATTLRPVSLIRATPALQPPSTGQTRRFFQDRLRHKPIVNGRLLVDRGSVGCWRGPPRRNGGTESSSMCGPRPVMSLTIEI